MTVKSIDVSYYTLEALNHDYPDTIRTDYIATQNENKSVKLQEKSIVGGHQMKR